MCERIKMIWQDEEGLTSVEYALLLALLVVGAIAVWTQFGSRVRAAVQMSSNSLTNVMT